MHLQIKTKVDFEVTEVGTLAGIIEAELKKVVDKSYVELLEKTTANWSRPAKFEIEMKPMKTKVKALIKTDSKVWHWIDKGTKPHKIEGTLDNPLRIKGGFSSGHWNRDAPGWKPMTYPKSGLNSGSGFYDPESDVSLTAVNHPGIEPRGFGKQLYSYNIIHYNVERSLTNSLGDRLFK